MANKYRNETSVVLNGREYTLRATFDALVEIERVLKMPFPQVQQTVFESKLSVKQGIDIFKVAARAAGQKIDEEQLKIDIEIEGVDAFGVGIIEFLKIALFGSEKLKKKSGSQGSQPKRSIGNHIWASLLASLRSLLKTFGR